MHRYRKGSARQVIEARPDELAQCPWIIFCQSKVHVRNIRPVAGLHVIAGRLVVLMLYAERLLHRKMVGAPGTDGRRRLGTQHEALRQLPVAILVTESAVIDSRNIQLGRETVGKHAVDLIHATCDRTRRVLPVTDGLKESRRLVTIGSALGRNLIADAPHDYGRRIPDAWSMLIMSRSAHSSK